MGDVAIVFAFLLTSGGVVSDGKALGVDLCEIDGVVRTPALIPESFAASALGC